MWPSHATLYLVPCTAQQEYDDKITFWKNICGLDFSPLMYVNECYAYYCVIRIGGVSAVVLWPRNNFIPSQSIIIFSMLKIACPKYSLF